MGATGKRFKTNFINLFILVGLGFELMASSLQSKYSIA
jgi:hypothetical protein